MEMTYLQFCGDNVSRVSYQWTVVFCRFLFLHTPVSKWASIFTHLVASKGTPYRVSARPDCNWSKPAYV